MADLEDLGYILQPHTSAGRIPSDKGYRFYVDMLMEEKEQEITKNIQDTVEILDVWKPVYDNRSEAPYNQ